VVPAQPRANGFESGARSQALKAMRTENPVKSAGFRLVKIFVPHGAKTMTSLPSAENKIQPPHNCEFNLAGRRRGRLRRRVTL